MHATALRAWRRPGPLVCLALAYLGAATAVMIWRGISVSPDYLLLLLVPVALASGRLLRFLGDWVPFVALFLGWEAMRGIAARSGIAPHVGDLAALETGIFGGHLPTADLQSAIASLGLGRAVDYAATAIYFCHFAVPVAVGMVLWLVDRVQFLRFVAALLGMAFAAFVVYLLAPTAPPWFAQDHGLLPGFRHVVGTTLPSAVSPYYSSLNPNQTAALPSLHAAFPTLGYMALRPLFPRASAAVLGYCLLVWFSVVYLGEHYVVDVAAGIVWAGAAWLLTTRVAAPRVAALRAAVGQVPAAAAHRPTLLGDEAGAPGFGGPLLGPARPPWAGTTEAGTPGPGGPLLGPAQPPWAGTTPPPSRNHP